MSDEHETKRANRGVESQNGNRAGAGAPAGYGTARVSAVGSARETKTSEHSIEDIWTWIRDGRGQFASTVAAIRATDGEDEQAELKRRLPGVMFAGTFAKRSSKDLIEASGLICIDFDHIDNPGERIDQMRFDPHIVMAFVSPRGHGIKAVFAIKDGDHQGAFETVRDYCAAMYELEADESGKDVSRLCFLSVDPEVHYAPDAVPLQVAPRILPRASKAATEGDRIGDRYHAAGDIRGRSQALLERAGWKIGRGSGDRTFCTRPGKGNGVSGTLWADGGFYCFTDQAPPLEPSRGYSALALYATLEHAGDYKAAVRELAEEFGDDEPVSGRDFYGKDASEIVTSDDRKEEVIAALPNWTSASDIPADLSKVIMRRYPVLIDGLLHRGTKMVLGGGSKSYKTWTLLNLAISVAIGGRWFGRKCVQTGRDVIFLNFEVPHEFFLERVKNVCAAMRVEAPENLKVWSLRGVCNDLRVILEALEKRLDNDSLGLICIDPIYKALGDRDENSAGDMGLLMNEVEALVERTGAAAAFGAHYSKGNQAEKDPLDRISGSGVFARDPDTIMGLTPHEEDGCFTVHAAVRNFPGIEPFVVRWEFPLFISADDLDPNKLRKGNQKINDSMILSIIGGSPEGKTTAEIIEILDGEASAGTIRNRVSRLKKEGKIREGAMMKYFTNREHGSH